MSDEPMLKYLQNIIGILIFSVPLTALAEYDACGPIERRDGGYGPYDYTDPSDYRNKLPVVNLHHFNGRVENLVGGFKEETPRPTGDITYVLHAFPNHHRALNAIVRLSWRENTPKPAGSKYSVDCWFDRAIRWRPADGMVRMIYANYLSSTRVKRFKEAIPHYELAEQKLKNNSNLFYNMGLLYFNLKDYEKSRDYARKAYAGGFPLSGLKDMLVKAGKWQS
jgi:tetratricopeptide (TPR) repeat protein